MKIKYIIFAIILSVITGCHAADKNTVNKSDNSNAQLNLQKYDFSLGAVLLQGKWEYFPGIFLNPGSDSRPACLLNFSEKWSGQSCGQHTIPVIGYGSYRLTVLLPDNELLMLKLGEIYTASRLIVNGKELRTAGFPGKDITHSKPGWAPHLVPVVPENRRLEIIIHVSNFHYYKGGPKQNILLGTHDDLQRLRENSLMIDLAVFGIILIMGLYHLMFYFSKRTDSSLLYFGILCIIIAFYHISTGSSYYSWSFSGFEWEIIIKITYLLIYLGSPIFIFYLHAVFPQDYTLRYVKIISVISLIFALSVFFPARYFSPMLPLFHYFLVGVSFYTVVIMLKIFIKKRQGSVLFLTGIMFFLISILNDVLYYQGILATGDMVSYGLIVLIASQTVLLARRYNSVSVRLELLEIERMELQNAIDRDNSSASTPRTLSPQLEDKMAQAMQYLKENYKEDVSREGLALSLDMHPDTFSRIFNLYSGKRIGDFIHELRIRDAAEKLLHSDATILDIAYDTGFDSLRTFNRAFKKIMQCTPSKYRNRK